jgi:hypothetical protein
MLGALHTGAARPEYIIFFFFNCNTISGPSCWDMCSNGITEIKGENGTSLYRVEKEYTRSIGLDFIDTLERERWITEKRPVLFKLNDDYTPY